MTQDQDLQYTIIIVIILDFLYDNQNTITTSSLEIKDKIIDQIQSFFQLKKAKNNSKRTTRVFENLTMLFKIITAIKEGKKEKYQAKRNA